MTTGPVDSTKHFLFASDFDQTLSFHDSGRAGRPARRDRFDEKVAGLARATWCSRAGKPY
jgi:hypothetical protein